MRIFRMISLQWAIGGYCIILGALMLVTPHQFYFPEYAPLHGNLLVLGTLFFLVGMAIFFSSAFSRRVWVIRIVCLIGSALLTALGVGFIPAQLWVWVVNYFLLAVFLSLVSFIGPYSTPGNSKFRFDSLDLFALFMGTDLVIHGILFLFFPTQFNFERFTLIQSYLIVFGLLFLVSGALLTLPQFFARFTGKVRKAGYLLGGLSFLFYLLIVPVVYNIWPGIIFYGGFGAVTLLLPSCEHWLAYFSPDLLRTRLALLLVATMAIPLIITVEIISAQEEQSATREILTSQSGEANTLAEGISHYIELHRAAALSLSLQPGILQMSPGEIHRQLVQYAKAYPDALAIALFDAEGNPVARSDDAKPTSIRGYPVYEQAFITLHPSQDILISPIYKRPVFAFGAPVLDNQGHFTGLVTIALDSVKVANYLMSQKKDLSIEAYLIDEKGRAIAHPNNHLVANFSDLSGNPIVDAFLYGAEDQGILISGPVFDQKFSSYARITNLGWGVILDRPAKIALAGVYRGRDLAFGIMLVFLLLTSLAGSMLASWLAVPLYALQNAATQLAAGNSKVPLPKSRITEVQVLARVFGEMRARLEQRTQERERAEEALRQANEELEVRVEARTADLARANEALQANAWQLERSNRELKDFAYIASHDLQEPLRKIQAFGERLKMRLSDNLDPDSQDYLERMQKSAKRMQSMIDDLLSYSRINTRGQPLTSVDLDQLVQDVISDLEIRIEQSGGQVETSGLPIIWADSLQMRQLFQNLIGNALKFHKPEICPLVKVSGQIQDDHFVEIQVEDNGIGFDEKYLDRIFQPFQRLHGRSEYEGSGIGLAICRKIVERHNGQITAKSVPGEGTAFIVRLPVHPPVDYGETN